MPNGTNPELGFNLFTPAQIGDRWDLQQIGAGSLFGLAVAGNQMGVYFVDDATNALNLLH